MDNLSDIFKELAKGADLLGKSIYKLQLSWEGPERAQTCQLFSSFPIQRAEVPKDGACLGIPKDHGTEGDP